MTPLKEVRASIKQQLEQTQKNEAMTKWVDELKKDYKDKVSYAHRLHAAAGRQEHDRRDQVAACLSRRRSRSCRS